MTIEVKPRRLKCSCCGEFAGWWLQWNNMDTGWGMCGPCAPRIEAKEGPFEMVRLYGRVGVHRPAAGEPLPSLEAWSSKTLASAEYGAALLAAESWELAVGTRDEYRIEAAGAELNRAFQALATLVRTN